MTLRFGSLRRHDSSSQPSSPIRHYLERRPLLLDAGHVADGAAGGAGGEGGIGLEGLDTLRCGVRASMRMLAGPVKVRWAASTPAVRAMAWYHIRDLGESHILAAGLEPHPNNVNQSRSRSHHGGMRGFHCATPWCHEQVPLLCIE